MLLGATQIIAGAPARHLHPVHLARSQAQDASGYVLVSYAGEGCTGRTFHDLYVFHGPAIVDTLRVTADLRYVVRREAAHRSFETYRHHPATRVSCYLADPRATDLLRSTCRLIPTLKFPLRGLDERALRALVERTPGPDGILEWSDLEGEHPSMLLRERRAGSRSTLDLPGERGRFLYYDLGENAAWERDTAAPGEARAHPREAATPASPEESLPVTPLARSAERLLRSFRRSAHESLGSRAAAAFERAEREVRRSAPGFDPGAIADESAVLVLELIERVVGEAPAWRRGALRRTAGDLLADFYGKQYDLLEERRLLDAVEQVYYRLQR